MVDIVFPAYPAGLRLEKACLVYKDIRTVACHTTHDMESTSFPLPLLYASPSLSSVSLRSSLDCELCGSWSLALFISMPAALSMGPGTEQVLSWPLVELNEDGDESSLNELKAYF